MGYFIIANYEESPRATRVVHLNENCGYLRTAPEVLRLEALPTDVTVCRDCERNRISRDVLSTWQYAGRPMQ